MLTIRSWDRHQGPGLADTKRKRKDRKIPEDAPFAMRYISVSTSLDDDFHEFALIVGGRAAETYLARVLQYVGLHDPMGGTVKTPREKFGPIVLSRPWDMVSADDGAMVWDALVASRVGVAGPVPDTSRTGPGLGAQEVEVGSKEGEGGKYPSLPSPGQETEPPAEPAPTVIDDPGPFFHKPPNLSSGTANYIRAAGVDLSKFVGWGPDWANLVEGAVAAGRIDDAVAWLRVPANRLLKPKDLQDHLVARGKFGGPPPETPAQFHAKKADRREKWLAEKVADLSRFTPEKRLPWLEDIEKAKGAEVRAEVERRLAGLPHRSEGAA